MRYGTIEALAIHGVLGCIGMSMCDNQAPPGVLTRKGLQEAETAGSGGRQALVPCAGTGMNRYKTCAMQEQLSSMLTLKDLQEVEPALVRTIYRAAAITKDLEEANEAAQAAAARAGASPDTLADLDVQAVSCRVSSSACGM